ncbi:hypothetical protein DFH08DRAFT_973837 [Mycena albidolilacea]|uniref:Uncharacterized protein n=1 Tax=Mycena albidolilacea TaxID=1033008 RepID=A0AAD6Z850_9AGAR|nr:hypothetical protein DFH08DRAFT_973837 [Mycena albidolilacea]
MPASSDTPRMAICGLPLLLPADFDFVSHKKRLFELPSPPAEDMDLQDKNSENLGIELHNKSGVMFNRACKAADIKLLDVRAPLQAFIAYSDKEKALFYLDHCYTPSVHHQPAATRARSVTRLSTSGRPRWTARWSSRNTSFLATTEHDITPDDHSTPPWERTSLTRLFAAFPLLTSILAISFSASSCSHPNLVPSSSMAAPPPLELFSPVYRYELSCGPVASFLSRALLVSSSPPSGPPSPALPTPSSRSLEPPISSRKSHGAAPFCRVCVLTYSQDLDFLNPYRDALASPFSRPIDGHSTSSRGTPGSSVPIRDDSLTVSPIKPSP